MKILTAKELALYLGCECVVSTQGDFSENWKPEILMVGTLLLFEQKGFEAIKPILRPLSDMTEVEAREFLGVVMNFNSQFSFGWDWEYSKGFLMIKPHTHTSCTVIKPFGENGSPVFNCSYTMNEGVWLMNKHFDLFGWIESGLAIDKTTLK